MSTNLDAAADLALQEARRALTYQADTVNELRSRTGVLVAAAAVIVSVLGSNAASGEGVGPFGIAAMGGFVCGIAVSLFILWPQEWTFVTSPKVLIEDWIEEEAQRGEDVRCFLAKCLDGHYSKNQNQLNRLMKLFQLAAVSVGTAVILGTIELASSF